MTVRGNLCKTNINTLIYIKLNAMTEPTETFSQLTLHSITPILSTNYNRQNSKMVPADLFYYSSENTPIPTKTQCACYNK